MANFSQAFGYKVYLLPILKGNVNLADLTLPGLGAGAFIDNTTLISNSGKVEVGNSGDEYGIGVGAASPLTITNVERTSNVVTLTVGSHTRVAGDVVKVDCSNNAVDGSFRISAVTGTTIKYKQTGVDITSAAATGSVTPYTGLVLDGTDDPVRLYGLTDASLDTSTSEEEIITYDDVSQGFDQSVATSKAFSMKLSGVTDFRDVGYKLLRIIEKDTVSAGTMCKLARIGPTGTDETVFGFGRVINFSEANPVKTVVKWSATFKGYGPYELDLDTN